MSSIKENRMQPSKTRSAFTLIELLVVIAIIAILAAILFPVFARARENARRSSCQSNLKQIGLGILQYTQDYDEKYPMALDSGTGGTYNFTWVQAIQPYIKSVQVFQCPSDPDAGQPAPAAGWAGIKCSYGGNALYANHVDGSGGDVYGFAGIFYTANYGGSPQSLSTVSSPSTTIMAADKFSSDTSSIAAAADKPFGNASGTGLFGVILSSAGLPNGTQSSTAYGDNTKMGEVSAKHLETANFLFADGHVKAMRPETTNPDGNYYVWGGSAVGHNINNPKFLWSAYNGG